MPIDREQIPNLIKRSQEQQLPKWRKNYYEKVAQALQVHTKGQLFSKVDTLFPNEHPASKAHCIATYEPITKSSIWKGINNLLRIFSSSSFSFNVGDDLREWLADYEWEGNNIVDFFLQEWVHKAVAEDPNGMFVIYPIDYATDREMCPVQWVRSELIRAKHDDFISFVSELDSDVTYTYENVVTSKEIFEDPKLGGMLNGRQTTKTSYNERLKIKVAKPVIHLFTREGFVVYQDRGKAEENVLISTTDFADTLWQIPVFPGGGAIADKADSPIYESFVQAFVPFGNLALIQHRNHRAVDLQFSYPRMSELVMPCDNQGCVGGKVGKPGKQTTCPKCGGNGFTSIQSPYKTYQQRYEPEGENKHLTVDPVKFYSPEVGIITYSKDAWKEYKRQAEEAIFIMQKVETGQVQSFESKEIDLDDMHAWLLNIAKTFYNNMRLMLQCFEEYISRQPMVVSVERPFSFAILTEGEAFASLTAILSSEAPIAVKGNQLDNFVAKFISKDSPINRILDILKQYDPLLLYSGAEVQTFKGSNVINTEMYTRHVLGYPVLMKLYLQDKLFLEQEDQVIMDALTAAITEMVPKNEQPAAFRSAILNQINQNPPKEETTTEEEQVTPENQPSDV